jgi:3-hydroxypropanoate dehydrogenase
MKPVSQDALAQLFLSARTQNGWLDKPVSDQTLREIYEIAKMGPTSMNTQPMRVLFLRSPEAKQRLAPALSPGNLDKTMLAPVTAIIARDTKFYEYMPEIWHNPAACDNFAANPTLAQTTAQRNAAKVDAEFFPDGRYQTDFLCNIGYGDPSKIMQRQPRHPFERACQLL